MKKLFSSFNHKKWLLILSLVLLCCIVVGTTLAFIIDETVSTENVFVPGEIDVSIDEEFDTETKKNVVVQNTGNTDAYVRAVVEITWVPEDDTSGSTVLGKMPKAGTDYTITYGSDWVEKDGIFYYPTAIAPNAYTTDLIVTCTDMKTMDGYVLSVVVHSELIQANPTKAVTEAWGVSVNADGSLSVS